MEYFLFCSKISQEERKKFNLDFQEIVRRISDLNMYNNSFENPYDRYAYMFKIAPCIISFIKDCVDKFLNECPVIKDVVQKWKVKQNMNFCSFSCGPALDYLAFGMALSKSVDVSFVPSFHSVTVVSNSAHWKHALQSLIESIKLGFLSFPISSLPKAYSVNHNPNMLFNAKHKVIVGNADVVFMVKTLNFSKPDEYEERKVYFQNIIAAMKMESYLFCIDTKPSTSAMFETLNQLPGKLIYGPVFNNFQIDEKFKFPESLKEVYGCLPVIMARGSFFVWEKTASNLTVPVLLSTNISKMPKTNNLYNNSTNASPSSIEINQHCVNTDNFDTDYSRDDQCKSEVSISRERKIGDIMDNVNLHNTLFTSYNFVSTKKSAKDLKFDVNLNKKLIDSSTNKEINATVEQEVKLVLSDICDIIDQSASILDKSVCDVSITKNELSYETACSLLSFDTFLEEMVARNKISEIKENYEFSNEPLFAVPMPDVKFQSVLDNFSTITLPPFIRSPIAPNRDLPNVTHNPYMCSSVVSNGDFSNATYHSSINSSNEPNGDLSNVTHHPFIRSPIARNTDLSTVTHGPTINSPTEPNKDFVKFPANQLLSSEYLSANNSEEYFTTETSLSEVAK